MVEGKKAVCNGGAESDVGIVEVDADVPRYAQQYRVEAPFIATAYDDLREALCDAVQ